MVSDQEKDMLDSIERDINVDDLVKLGIYLEGIKAGKGNLQPLGTVVLDTLWQVVVKLRNEEHNKK